MPTMKLFFNKVIYIPILLSIFSLSCSKKHLTSRVWDTEKKGFEYPENNYSKIKGRPNIGICFSGGGTRSASATLGQLRGLNEIGVLDSIKYISAVSGGAWTALTYTYLQDDTVEGRELFLGKYTKPKNITEDNLSDAKKGYMGTAIKGSYVFHRVFGYWLAGRTDETYSSILNSIFLKRFSLSNRSKFFAYNKAQVSDIIDRTKENYPNSKLTKDDFYITNPHRSRPYLIVNGTLNGGTFRNPDTHNTSFEITPLYCGVPVYNNDNGIGGVYTEPHAFDIKLNKKNFNGLKEVQEFKLSNWRSKKRRFTLSDAMGVTGAAPGHTLNRCGLDALGFPEFRIFSPKTKGKKLTRELEFTDGGNLENLGLIPLLKRGVEKIIVFSNSPTKLESDPVLRYEKVSGNLKRIFGVDNDFNGLQLLKNGTKFKELINAFVQLKQDSLPPIYIDTYEVLDNPKYGIKQGKVEIMFINLNRSSKWEEALPPSIKQDIIDGKYDTKPFKIRSGYFPNYATFATGGAGRLIKLKKKQVNLLAHLTSWVIVSNESSIREFLNN